MNDMSFWREVFPKAIDELKKTRGSKQGQMPQWSIHQCQVRADVHLKLERARDDYDHLLGPKYVGRFRRKLRSILDRSMPSLRQIAKGVPSSDIASPIVSVANVLLDVSTTQIIHHLSEYLKYHNQIVKQLKGGIPLG
jgi:hypothetical protein